MLRPLLRASTCSPSPHVGDRFVSEGEETHQKKIGRRRPSFTPALDDDGEGLIVVEGVGQVAVEHLLRPRRLQAEIVLVREGIGTHDALLPFRGGQAPRLTRRASRQPARA